MGSDLPVVLYMLSIWVLFLMAVLTKLAVVALVSFKLLYEPTVQSYQQQQWLVWGVGCVVPVS